MLGLGSEMNLTGPKGAWRWSLGAPVLLHPSRALGLRQAPLGGRKLRIPRQILSNPLVSNESTAPPSPQIKPNLVLTLLSRENNAED